MNTISNSSFFPSFSSFQVIKLAVNIGPIRLEDSSEHLSSLTCALAVCSWSDLIHCSVYELRDGGVGLSEWLGRDPPLREERYASFSLRINFNLRSKLHMETNVKMKAPTSWYEQIQCSSSTSKLCSPRA